jgi:CTP synthase
LIEKGSDAENSSARRSKSFLTSPTKSNAVISRLGEDDVDVVITEIGGTVGDIESQPFLGSDSPICFAMWAKKIACTSISTLIPYLKAAGELKTKPTQHSVGQLRQIGIQPDVLICRTERHLPASDREKIALFCNVPVRAVIEGTR